MKEFLKNMSLVPKGLRYKLMVAYCLMAIIPLLICVYLASNFIFPYTQEVLDVSIVILITMGITFLGFILAKEIVEPIIKIAVEAGIIARGDIDRIIEVKREDEIGDLGHSLNMITSRIKDNMEELRLFGERTKQINTEIHKKVLSLTGLLQIGNLITAAVELDKILEFCIEKVVELPDVTIGFLMMLDDSQKEFVVKAAGGIEFGQIIGKKLSAARGLVGRIVKSSEPLAIDAGTKPTAEVEDFKKDFQLINCALYPVTSRGKNMGILGVGNDLQNYKFTQDDLELFKVFVRQIGIAIENDLLMKRAKELAITDDLTGLYNEAYIRTRLDEEIKRAIIYQRPCAFILMDVDNYKAFIESHGGIAAEEALKRIALILKESTTTIDKVARFGDDIFAVVLPEKNKRDALKVAEDLRAKVQQKRKGEEIAAPAALTVSAGVSENPIDGSTAEELIKRAEGALKKAKLEGKNRVAG